MLFIKKLNLFIIFVLIFTSTIEAKRLKSKSDYFLILKEDVKMMCSKLDELTETMNKIHEKNTFVKNTFYGVKPNWYGKNYLITTSYPYISYRKQKNFIKNIRNIPLKWVEEKKKDVEMGFYMPEFLDESYIKQLLRNKGVIEENIELATKEYQEHQNKNKEFLKETLITKLQELYENTAYIYELDKLKKDIKKRLKKQFKESKDHSSLIEENKENLKFSFKNHLEYKYRRNIKKKNIKDVKSELYNELIRDSKYWQTITLRVTKTVFKIGTVSKNELYDKQIDFLSILDEYEQKGICIKKTPTYEETGLRIGSSRFVPSDYVMYEAKNDKYKGHILYNKKYNRGEWVPATWELMNNIAGISNEITELSKTIIRGFNKYNKRIWDEIIKKYKFTETKKDFGNEF